MNRRSVATWAYVWIYVVVLAGLALTVGPLRSPTDVTETYCNISAGLGAPLGSGPCSSVVTHQPPAMDGPTARRALLAAYNTLMSAEQSAGLAVVDRSEAAINFRSDAEGNFTRAVALIQFPDLALADVQTLSHATNDTDENARFISLPAVTAAVAAITRDLVTHRA